MQDLADSSLVNSCAGRVCDVYGFQQYRYELSYYQQSVSKNVAEN